MRIDSNQTPQPLPESGRSSNQSPASADFHGAASNGLGEDSAQLSGTHAQVQALVAQALQFPEVRQGKVDALRQAVESGSYQPSSKQVADSMFEHLVVRPAA